MPMQIVAYPRELRAHLAALDLQRETGTLSPDAYDREVEAVLEETRILIGLEGTWRNSPSPPEPDHPTGRQMCWWQLMGATTDLRGVLAASAARLDIVKSDARPRA